jgi:ribonuclease P protein component
VTEPAPAYLYRQRHRLTHAREFEAVYAGKCRKNRGTLMIFTLPNTLSHPRLGLAVGTRVGGAVVRTRIKRLIREAFRLRQFDLAKSSTGGYDIIVSVRGSAVPILMVLGDTLVELVRQTDLEWRRRERSSAPLTESSTGVQDPSDV